MGALIVEDLSPENKRAFLVAQVYEEERRKLQKGYRLATDADEAVLEKATWKQCRTIGTWLESIGWPVSPSLGNWQGYLRYAFWTFKPQLPLPGQLKNLRLVRQYMTDHRLPEKPKVKRRSKEEMDELYRKIIRPELRSCDHFLRRIGLDG